MLDPVNSKKVYSHCPGPTKTQLDKNDAIDLSALSDLFAEKYFKLIIEKAQTQALPGKGILRKIIFR